MYTSYSIEKIASTNRREAIAAAEARRVTRAVRRSTPAEPRPASPTSDPIRIPRRRRWFGVAVPGQ